MHHLGEIDWSEMEEADLRREFAPARRSLHPDPRDPAYDGPPEPEPDEAPAFITPRGTCLCGQTASATNQFWCQDCLQASKKK